MATEFEVQTDLTKFRSFQIKANFDSIKAELKEMVEPYENLVVTEETEKDAKAAKAQINKWVKSIDDARKTVKKLYTAPLADFEARCRDAMEVGSQVSGQIDGKLHEIDESRKKQKFIRLAEFYAENIGDVAEFIPFDRISDERWGNKTFSEEEAQQSILREIGRAKAEIEAIHNLGSNREPALLAEYKRCGNLAAVLNWNREMDEFERSLEERKNKFTPFSEPVENPELPEEEQEEPDSETETSTEILTVDFRVSGTQKQFDELGAFLRSHGMKYGKVPKN